MSWRASGGVGERLRALRVRDDIIRKQDPTMGALAEQGLNTDVQNVQGPMGDPGALPAHMIGAGNKSAADDMWVQLESWVNDGEDILNAGQRVSTEFGSANIDHNFIRERNGKILQMRQMFEAMRNVLAQMKNDDPERSLREHDPTQMANDQTNGNLNAMVPGMGGTGGAM